MFFLKENLTDSKFVVLRDGAISDLDISSFGSKENGKLRTMVYKSK